MNAIEKIENDARIEIPRFVDLHNWSKNEKITATYMGFHIINFIKEALAALEAEKPVEEPGEWDRLTKKEMWDTIQEIRQFVDSDGTESIISDINRIIEDKVVDLMDAENKSYHAKLCAECKQNDGWISVKNRMPCEQEEVLIFDGSVQVDRLVDSEDDPCLVWEYNFDNPSITHWQPLPKEPK
jgi:hypothetical protein